MSQHLVFKVLSHALSPQLPQLPLNYPVMSILQMRKVKSGELKRSFRIIYHVHGKAWTRGGIARLNLIP